MSCHHIGLGMNSVVRKIITLMDAEEISKETAKKLIKACANGVHWCDGNEYEAVAYISRCLCGNCLEKLPEGEKLYELPDPFDDSLWDKIDKEIVHSRLCEKCFDEFIGKFYGHYDSEEAGKKKTEAVRCSTGDYSKTNNGFRWVD